MRQISTFESLVGLVHEMSAPCHDETIPVSAMSFESLDRMRITGRNIKVFETAQRLIANRLRVPYSYLARCPMELQAQNLNYWIEEEAKTRDTLFCRFKGDGIRAVFTDRYTTIDHMEILSRMLEYGFNPETEVHYSLDESLMVLKVPDFSKKFGLNGDDIIPGISVANSEVGVVAFSIEAYFYRLVCSNGLISKTEVVSRFKHISRKAMDHFPEILGQVVHESEGGERQLRISSESHVTDPIKSIDAFGRQFKLAKRETEAAQSAWNLEQGYTLFHVINAFTRGAQDASLNAEEGYSLERAAGMILAMVKV
jgi:hypothetical protein